MSASPLARCVAALERLAPARLAAKWDNVGLLVGHADEAPGAATFALLLTNDLTMPVLREAIARRVSLIVTYHPTPFSALKRFGADAAALPAARVVLLCARHGIAVYSPHTAWDHVADGLNDWLVSGVLAAAGVAPRAIATLPLAPAEGATADEAAAGAGEGRCATFGGVTLAQLVEGVKRHLALEHVQLALPAPAGDEERARDSAAAAAAGVSAVRHRSESLRVSGLSVCAGAGASLLPRAIEAARRAGASATGSAPCHVYLTGEMGHHDVLAATSAGLAVVLTQHSKCERGYLSVVQRRLEAAFASLEPPLRADVLLSQLDADPLTIV